MNFHPRYKKNLSPELLSRSWWHHYCPAGVEFDDTISKADASKKIDELQQKTGRGAA